jgi:hypothetical protein
MSTEKLFLTSVADYWMYDQDQVLLASGKSLSDSTIALTVANTDVRGGKGAGLEYVYFHSPDMKITLTDTQFNPEFISAATGGNFATDTDVWVEESVAVTGGAGTVTLGTPVAFLGSTTKYGWCQKSDGTITRVSFSGSNFTLGSYTGTVCVRYYINNDAAKIVTVPSNIIPSIVTLVLSAQLASNEDAANIVGSVQIEIPRFQVSGSMNLNLKMDAVSTTPIEGRCLAYTPTASGACVSGDVFGYIKEYKTASNWWDDCTTLAFSPNDISLVNTPSTYQTTIFAVHSDGTISQPPFADLDLVSVTTAKATISSTGLITTVAAGTTVITATIHDKTSVTGVMYVTVTAP